MNNFLKIIFSIVVLMFIASCGNQTEDDQFETSKKDNTEEHSGVGKKVNKEYSNLDDDIIKELPNKVELSYESVELSKLNKNEPTDSMELVSSISLGDIENKKISLNVYKETNENNQCGESHETLSFLEFNGDEYQINECTSKSLLADDHKEDAIYLINHKFNSNQKLLLSGIELSANGPGRMLYLMYDMDSNEWLTFEDWGFPLLEDIDESNNITFLNQFPGLHFEGPDVNIYRWHHGKFERSIKISKAMGLSSKLISAIRLEQNVFNVLVQLEDEKQLSAEYKYEEGKLVKVNNK
ncbi:MAG: hypothetical protein H0Z32_01375 [Bacillaceae bacterium]|nr:hypothetical protein [Bacillaceae bacterium]